MCFSVKIGSDWSWTALSILLSDFFVIILFIVRGFAPVSLSEHNKVRDFNFHSRDSSAPQETPQSGGYNSSSKSKSVSDNNKPPECGLLKECF